jgi:hypothetical protein
MAKVVYDACIKTGTYQKDGQEKARWMQIGRVFENDRGLSLKLDALPLAGSGDCWIKLFPAKGKGNG